MTVTDDIYYVIVITNVIIVEELGVFSKGTRVYNRNHRIT